MNDHDIDCGDPGGVIAGTFPPVTAPCVRIPDPGRLGRAPSAAKVGGMAMVEIAKLRAELAAAEKERDSLKADIAELRAIKVAVAETPKQWSTAMAPTMEAIAAAARQITTAKKNESLVAERDALRRFKEYVHARLDAAGVPVDPESPHKAEGCRIGGRLDHLLADRDRLKTGIGHAIWMIGDIKDRHPEVTEEGWHELDAIRCHLTGVVMENDPAIAQAEVPS